MKISILVLSHAVCLYHYHQYILSIISNFDAMQLLLLYRQLLTPVRLLTEDIITPLEIYALENAYD